MGAGGKTRKRRVSVVSPVETSHRAESSFPHLTPLPMAEATMRSGEGKSRARVRSWHDGRIDGRIQAPQPRRWPEQTDPAGGGSALTRRQAQTRDLPYPCSSPLFLHFLLSPLWFTINTKPVRVMLSTRRHVKF